MGEDLHIDRKSAMILTMLIVAKNKVLNRNKDLLCAQTISTPGAEHFLQRISIVTQAPKTHFHPTTLKVTPQQLYIHIFC